MRQAPTLWFERLVILAGLLSFWPYVFGHRSVLYGIGLVVTATLLGVVAALRVRRFNRQVGDTSHQLRAKSGSTRRGA